MQLTKGYFVISRLVHRLGRAQSYREGGGEGKVCRQQAGCGQQPLPEPARFYPPATATLLSLLRLDTGKETSLRSVSICCKDNNAHKFVSQAPLGDPAPLLEFMEHFLDTSWVYDTVLGAKMAQREHCGALSEEDLPTMCRDLDCPIHSITKRPETHKR